MPSTITSPVTVSTRLILSLVAAVVAGLTFYALIDACPARADEEAERMQLRRSWAEACGHYDELTNWTARQACNLAWFRAHEKAVWQHNLNPHGPATGGPSS